MIDIHTHILPGIDDGITTEDDAVEFARVAVADGVREIVATPHCKEGVWPNGRQEVMAGIAKLRDRLRREGVSITLHPGAEVHLCPDLIPRIHDGRAPTLADNGKTLLLELSLTQYPVELENLVFQLNLAGITTIFAHPERIRFFQDDLRRYEAVVRLGAHGQITTGSVLGSFGRTAHDFSEELLRKGLVDVLATDAHNVHGRPPRLGEALRAMEPLVGERRARCMVEDIPRALLEGREPEVPPVESTAPSRTSFLGRLFGRGRSG